MSILVQDLARSFGDLDAVRHVRFDVQPGTIFGLLGANGAGKTTTLRMLATLLQPSSGTARIHGHDIRESPIEVRKNLGYLTGDTGLYGRLTPKETFVFFGKLYGMSPEEIKTRTEWLVNGLGMAEFFHTKCGKLSTGQQQRVNIARALLHDPAVLIFDEPTSGLDIISAQFILDVLREEKERGKTVLFSTHILAEAELLCDVIGLLHQGQLLHVGTLDEICSRWEADSLTHAMIRATESQAEATS